MIDPQRTWRELRALAQQERTSEAMQLLREYFEEGGWFAPDRLLDQQDLLSLRERSEFAGFVDLAKERRDVAIAHAPPSLTLVSPLGKPPWPVLLALHGNDQNVLDVLPYWSSAAEIGWLVALPQSGSIIAPDSYAWAAATTGEISRHVKTIEKLSAISDLVVAGSGRGAYHALRIAISGFVAARAVIAVSPSMNDLDEIVDSFPKAAERGLRVAFVFGSDDEVAHRAVSKVSEQFQKAGIDVLLDERAGQGHGFPPNFDQTLRALLEEL
ncbi:MAG: alpha/beta hydrolase [Actinomycetota bacterium]